MAKIDLLRLKKGLKRKISTLRRDLSLLAVVSPRIELGYQVPETCVLSIVLRDQHYPIDCIKPLRFAVKILTAMASKITPKNLRMAIKPPVPNSLAI